MFERKIRRSEMLKCALCKDAPCTNACPNIDPAKVLRSIWFDNEKGALANLPENNPCLGCSRPCEEVCVRPHEVPIQKLLTRLYDEVKPELEITYPHDEERLRTDLCGVPLENPFMLSSSVVASNYDMCARAFEAGWAGVCFKTICSFDIHEASPRFSALTGDNGSIIGFKNIEQLSDHSIKENMEIFHRLKEKYPTKVIFASIMGKDEEEWGSLAQLCELNGADAIELNFSCPNMMDDGLGSDIGQIPELVERFTAVARKNTTVPLFAKLTPNVQTMSPAALAAKRGGADGVSAINTIKSIMGINPHTFVSAPSVHGASAVGGYSGAAVKPIALRFVEELANNPELKGLEISGMGGVEKWTDALDFLLLGANTIQVTTAIMQYGYRIIEDLKSGLNNYLAELGFQSVKEIVGFGLDAISETTDNLERDTIIFPKFHHDRCIGCGRCEIACADGGHQAIQLNDKRRPVLNGSRCVGCHLCTLICSNRAITPSAKRIKKPKN